jgi:hypothetical protein
MKRLAKHFQGISDARSEWRDLGTQAYAFILPRSDAPTSGIRRTLVPQMVLDF